MAIYDAASAIQQPNIVGAYQQGLTFRNALADLAAKRAEEQRQIEIRNGLAQFYRQAQPERVTDLGISFDAPQGGGMFGLSGAPSVSMQPKVAPATPASFDYQGAADYLASRGDFNALANLQKMQAGGQGGADAESFFAPQFGYDASGKLVPVQFGNRGSAKRGDLPDGVTALAFPNEYKDAGGRIVALPKYGNASPTPVVDKTLTPDAAVSNDPIAQQRIAEAKAKGSAVGQGQGDQVVAAGKEAVNAGKILAILDEAEPLIKRSTGSLVGKGVDVVSGAIGVTTPGAEAGDQLAILGSKLVMMVPRFEGPQSNIDVKSYEKAAGDLANTAIPRERRLAALRIIRQLNQKYAGGVTAPDGQGQQPQQPGWKAAGYRNLLEAHADYKKARDSAYKAGNFDLVRRIDEEARKDGVIR